MSTKMRLSRPHAKTTATPMDLELIGCRGGKTASYTHLRAHDTLRYLVCRLLLEKKKKKKRKEKKEAMLQNKLVV